LDNYYTNKLYCDFDVFVWCSVIENNLK